MNQDYILHAPNIARMLMLRGYLAEPEPVIKALADGHKARATHIEFTLQRLKDHAKLQSKVIQEQRQILDMKAPVLALETLLLVYVYQEQELPNMDIVKKYAQAADLLIFICDDGSMRRIRAKVEKLSEDEFPRASKRAEFIHHDNLFIDLTKNAHASHYQLTDPRQLQFMLQHLRVKHTQLPYIQANDPLLLYYGLPEYTVVTQTYESSTVAGQKIDYLLVIPEMSNSIYLGHIL